MRSQLKSLISFSFLTLLFSTPLLPNSLNLPPSNPYTQTQYQQLTLPNGLRVLLISNPTFKQSAASLVVKSGSYQDPGDIPGLAHFLEHMLFISTKKYPEIDGYQAFITQHNGQSNAYTAGDHTNYYFSVADYAFPEALDRFSQFFIAPLFRPEYAEKERNAVHSEFQKNKLQDAWRIRQIQRALYVSTNALAKFDIGSNHTLKYATPERLQQFYEDHYSANQMALVLASSTDLFTLNQFAKTYFSQIPNRKLPDNTYDSHWVTTHNAVQVISYPPIAERRELQFYFPWPSEYPFMDSKMPDFIASLLGSELSGSLYDQLRKEGWITHLNAYSHSLSPEHGIVGITVSLTDAGLTQKEAVMAQVFTYLKWIQSQAFPVAKFDEFKQRLKNAYLFNPPESAVSQVRYYAPLVAAVPNAQYDRLPYDVQSTNISAYHYLLSRLVPETAFVFVVAPTTAVDRLEPYFESPYAVTWNATLHAHISKMAPKGRFPAVNALATIPISVKPITPLQLINTAPLTLWFAQDQHFKDPRIQIVVDLTVEKRAMTPEMRSVFPVIIEATKLALANDLYEAAEAGASVDFGITDTGISLRLNGYRPVVSVLLDRVLKALRDRPYSEALYLDMRRHQLDALASQKVAPAYQIGLQQLAVLNDKNDLLPEEASRLLSQLSFRKAQDMQKRLLSTVSARVFVYGNATADDALTIGKTIKDQLHLRRVRSPFSERYLIQNPGDKLHFGESIKTNNNFYAARYSLGERTVSTVALGMVLGQLVQQPYFKTLRTDQQLGYIVYGAERITRSQVFLQFLIMSGTYDPIDLDRKSTAFFPELIHQLNQLSETDYEAVKTALIDSLEKKPQSIDEAAQSLYRMLNEEAGNFNYKTQLIQAIHTLSKTEALRRLEAAIMGENRQEQRLWLFGQEAVLPSTLQLPSVEAVKAKQSYRSFSN